MKCYCHTLPEPDICLRCQGIKDSAIVEAAQSLFDNRLGWSEGRPPYALRDFWADLGAALYGEDNPRVKELREGARKVTMKKTTKISLRNHAISDQSKIKTTSNPTDNVDELEYSSVLDRASLIADMFDEKILQHSVLEGEPELKEEAKIICKMLHDFYQNWGSVISEKFAK